MDEGNNLLSVLESLMPPATEDVARQLADDFRKRRIEKNLTRQQIADKSGVALANITRFEQKSLISLHNLIELAIALGYVYELRNIFATPKFNTIRELDQIHKNAKRSKAYPLHRTSSPSKNKQS
jgi:transcriptional regulator with XRE-family HTH domain